MKNGKRKSSYPYENKKTRKIAQRRGTTDKKQEKDAFVGVRRAKNGESWPAYPYNL